MSKAYLVGRVDGKSHKIVGIYVYSVSAEYLTHNTATGILVNLLPAFNGRDFFDAENNIIKYLLADTCPEGSKWMIPYLLANHSSTALMEPFKPLVDCQPETEMDHLVLSYLQANPKVAVEMFHIRS
jgi:hypothetical protein